MTIPGPVIAVLLAAGTGTRMGSATPKVLMPLRGRTVLEWAAAAFEQTPEVDSTLVVAHLDSVPAVSRLMAGFAKVEAIVPGGATRSASTRAAIDAIAADNAAVLVHDAARPLVTPDTISNVVSALRSSRAVTVAAPASDTILRAADGFISDIPDRSHLWHAQTPQAFDLAILRIAYGAAGDDVPDFSDDCGIVRHYVPHEPIAVVAGDATNLKITRPEDLEVAELLLARRDRA